MDSEIARKLIMNAAEMMKGVPDQKLGHDAQMVVIASAQAYAQIASAMTLVRIAEALEKGGATKGEGLAAPLRQGSLTLLNCASGSHEACEGAIEMAKGDEVEVWVCTCACHQGKGET